VGGEAVRLLAAQHGKEVGIEGAPAGHASVSMAIVRR
jgi:hypothetical protein